MFDVGVSQRGGKMEGWVWGENAVGVDLGVDEMSYQFRSVPEGGEVSAE